MEECLKRFNLFIKKTKIGWNFLKTKCKIKKENLENLSSESLGLLKKLCKRLNVDFDWLICKTNKEPFWENYKILKVKILTIFPEMFKNIFDYGQMGVIKKRKILKIQLIDLKKYSQKGRIDRKIVGGGVGLLITAPVIENALKSKKIGKAIYMSPRGKTLSNEIINKLKIEDNITIICGRYEGIDNRVIEHYNIEEISIGDYVLLGGELPAMVLIEALARNRDFTVGNKESLESESFSNGLLEYPQYALPKIWKKREIPKILFSGNHREIEKWKKEESIKITKKNRPDLYDKHIKNLNILK